MAFKLPDLPYGFDALEVGEITHLFGLYSRRLQTNTLECG